MPTEYFKFKQFTIYQDRCAMKVTTDACLFGSWVANDISGDRSDSSKILDIGTGTGLLTLMTAQKNHEVIIDAIEVDENSAQQAKQNAEASPWHARIKLIHADIRNFDFQMQYEIIISNPPFYQNELSSPDLKRNIAHHNASLLFTDLLPVIKNNLKADGIFYLLLPSKRNREVEKLLKKHELFISKKVCIRQSIDHDFFRIIIKGSKKTHDELEKHELSIWSKNKQHTPEFVDLLKDYYLNL